MIHFLIGFFVGAFVVAIIAVILSADSRKHSRVLEGGGGVIGTLYGWEGNPIPDDEPVWILRASAPYAYQTMCDYAVMTRNSNRYFHESVNRAREKFLPFVNR